MAATRASRAIRKWLRSGTEDDPHTQELLAERLGEIVRRPVSQGTISSISRGDQLPRADLVAALYLVLRVRSTWWLPDRPHVDRPPVEHNGAEDDDAA